MTLQFPQGLFDFIEDTVSLGVIALPDDIIVNLFEIALGIFGEQNLESHRYCAYRS